MSHIQSTSQTTGEFETTYEDEHVHQVYNSIAPHFSSTRFKPWPIVDSFLRDLPAGSVGLDIGCGNGKYLSVRKDVFIVGSDRSSELLKFAARHQPHDVAIADTLNLPHSSGTFDFAISIAVIHHLSTRERRRAAVRCILQTLKQASKNGRNGEALVFVWALEQKNSRRGWDAGHEQDVLVPWVLKGDESQKKPKNKKMGKNDKDLQGIEGNGVSDEKKADEQARNEGKVYQRYYHLYEQGELEADIEAVGGVVVRNGYDRDNWWAVCARGDDDDGSLD